MLLKNSTGTKVFKLISKLLLTLKKSHMVFKLVCTLNKLNHIFQHYRQHQQAQ